MTDLTRDPALHFLWLEVSDLAFSVDFYRATLGLPVQEDPTGFAIVHLAQSRIYLAPGAPRGMGLQIGIAVPDIDALGERLRSHGVQAPTPIDEGWARYIPLRDPDGYQLLLLQPTPPIITP